MTDVKEWVASLPQTTPSQAGPALQPANPLQRYRECCCAEPDDRGSYYDAEAIDKLREDDLNELERLAAEVDRLRRIQVEANAAALARVEAALAECEKLCLDDTATIVIEAVRKALAS